MVWQHQGAVTCKLKDVLNDSGCALLLVETPNSAQTKVVDVNLASTKGPMKTTIPISTNNVQESAIYNNPNQPCAPVNPATCCDSQRLADKFTTLNHQQWVVGLLFPIIDPLFIMIDHP